MLTDNARHKNVSPPLDLTRTLKPYHKRNGKRKFLKRQEQAIPHEINRTI